MNYDFPIPDSNGFEFRNTAPTSTNLPVTLVFELWIMLEIRTVNLLIARRNQNKQTK